ncbi:MAG: FAD-binding protein [Treponema sp.]|jgi:electron transfer flavoprotein alpha subunit|nr:FAD-binding protein [Treponema sp.]
MTIALVLSRAADPAASLLHDFIAPITETGDPAGSHAEDRVEFWLSAPEPWSPDIRHTESRIRLLERLWMEHRPDLIVLPGTLAGHELAVRLSARLNCGCFPETSALLREGNRLFARKKVCGSNLNRDTEITDYPAVLTVTGKKTPPGNVPRKDWFPLIERRVEPPVLPEWILEYQQAESFPDNPLETAPLIFAAGRGLGSKAACDRLRRIAGRFGAPLGFSRPAALNGWGEIAGIIGQSGVRTNAEVCVALGVSGAAAFMTGIESPSTLIAVNPDKNAPIFRYADTGIIAGAEEFIAAMENL